MKRTLILGIAAATAASAPVFFQAPAQAACLTTNGSATNCATFDQTTASNVVDGGYTDTVFVANNRTDRIAFYHSGFTSGLPITLTGIFYSLDGGTTWSDSNITGATGSGGTYTITSAYISGDPALIPSGFAGPNLLSGPILGSQANVQLKFTIPTGSLGGSGFSLTSYIGNSTNGTTTPQTQTRTHILAAPPAATPGPLPLLGAGAAFGLSRRIRTRIRVVA